MAISRAYLGGTDVNSIGIGSSGHTTIATSSSGYYDPRYWDKQDAHEQERRYREELERQRYAAMQAYCINTDTYGGMTAQQMQEAKPVNKVGKVEPDYLSNQKLLLLGEAS